MEIKRSSKISINLWFETQAEEAARFYTSVFENSRLGRLTRYSNVGEDIHGQKNGNVMTVEFELEGCHFVALNGGPQFKFTEAISLIVNCNTQEEIDYYWESLSEGGDESAQVCGWLKDRFGVSWQIVPACLLEMLNDPDPKKVQQVTQTMLSTPKKLDIEALEKAYIGN